MSKPPTAAVAEPIMNVNEIIRFTLIPERAAIILSCEVARMALPILVNFIRIVSKTITIAVATIIDIS